MTACWIGATPWRDTTRGSSAPSGVMRSALKTAREDARGLGGTKPKKCRLQFMLSRFPGRRKHDSPVSFVSKARAARMPIGTMTPQGSKNTTSRAMPAVLAGQRAAPRVWIGWCEFMAGLVLPLTLPRRGASTIPSRAAHRIDSGQVTTSSMQDMSGSVGTRPRAAGDIGKEVRDLMLMSWRTVMASRMDAAA